MKQTQRRVRRWLGVIRGGRAQVVDLSAYRAAKAARVVRAQPETPRPAA